MIKALRAQGWSFLRDARGSHEIWTNHDETKKVAVPVGHRTVSPGVLQQLKRQGLAIPKEWI
ncbi:type II toxin-antitoxin system HicA family toxin [Brevibacterium sp. UMB10442]|nr:type II toxin-antitoxin system HicA family toxin [Brevibacterium sp. UMB10442]